MNKDAYNLPIYKEVLKQVNEFVEEHPEALTMPKEELVKLLDEVTNGNYSTVATDSGAELKAPAEKKVGVTEIINTKTETEFREAQTRQQALMNQIRANSEQMENKFTVDKKEDVVKENEIQEKSNFSELELKNKAFRSAENITKYLKETGESKFGFATEVFKKFSDMGSTTQDWAMNYFSNASSTVQNLFLNKITGSFSGMVAAAKEVDLSKFNLVGVSVTTQKEIDKIQVERNFA